MHAILVSMGTDGDVFPFVGLGARLRLRGHRVTLVANQHYQTFASHHGLAFRALVSDEETNELMDNPDVWHPIKSALVGARWAGPAIERQYALLTELATGKQSVLVSYPPIFAARLVHEMLLCPLVSLVAMPWMIPSVISPPTLAGPINLPRWAPRLVVKLHWRLLEAAGDLLVGRHVNNIRRAAGLKSIRRIVRWSFSPQLVLGLFPEWYAPPQPDWPPQTRLAGFPLFDGGKEDRLPKDVLDFCRAGPPPVAFTFGSGMRHGAQLFRASVEACQILGARGILLTKFAQQLPVPLPPFVHYCQYAPFGELFPRCTAVVHHGGIGTTAQGLAAGLPQLILPMAWDQPDNAARLKHLGVGDWLKRKQSSGAEIAKALAKLMTPETRARCRTVAARFADNDALEIAVQWVEDLASCRKISTFQAGPEPAA